MADDEFEPISEEHREQIKLTANYLNGLAVALAAIGGISFAFQYAVAHPQQNVFTDMPTMGFVSIVLAASCGVHCIGLWVLGSLKRRKKRSTSD